MSWFAELRLVKNQKRTEAQFHNKVGSLSKNSEAAFVLKDFQVVEVSAHTTSCRDKSSHPLLYQVLIK